MVSGYERTSKTYILYTNTCIQTHIYIYIHMSVSENSGTPKSSILIVMFHYKPSILGAHPYFWKHPYMYIYIYIGIYNIQSSSNHPFRGMQTVRDFLYNCALFGLVSYKDPVIYSPAKLKVLSQRCLPLNCISLALVSSVKSSVFQHFFFLQYFNQVT